MLLVLAFHSISKHERGIDPFCREKKTFTRGRRFVSLRGHQDAEIMLDYFRIRKKNREKKAQRNLNLGLRLPNQNGPFKPRISFAATGLTIHPNPN